MADHLVACRAGVRHSDAWAVLARIASLVVAALLASEVAAWDSSPARTNVAVPSVEELAMPPQKPADARESDTRESICLIVEAAARDANLPLEFFARVIWQESRFQADAVGPMTRSGEHAQGIAQFMPGTAQWRGLADPFEPCQALRESARWLRELWSQFGNLGLAAAAYNAGPNRVTRWLSGRTTLPSETRAYVQIITGEVAERWTECRSEPESKQSCPDVYAGATVPPARINVVREAGAHGPWGLQLAGDWSEARALSEFQKLQTRFPSVLGDRKAVVLRSQIAGRGSASWYRIRVAEATRERANELCARLERVGGRCIVLRN